MYESGISFHIGSNLALSGSLLAQSGTLLRIRNFSSGRDFLSGHSGREMVAICQEKGKKTIFHAFNKQPACLVTKSKCNNYEQQNVDQRVSKEAESGQRARGNAPGEMGLGVSGSDPARQAWPGISRGCQYDDTIAQRSDWLAYLPAWCTQLHASHV